MIYNRFIRPQREGDLNLYIEVLGEMIPYVFTFNHSNYARWRPVHVRVLMNLKTQVQKGTFCGPEITCSPLTDGEGSFT